MRSPLAAALCVAVLATLQQSPGLHVHHNDQADQHVSEAHHHGAASHIHADAHSHVFEHELSVWPQVDDDPILLDGSWLKPERLKLVVGTSPGRTAVILPLPSPSSQRWVSTQPRAHDPPGGSPRIPRAPPAFNLA